MTNFWGNPFFNILALLFFAVGLTLTMFVPHGAEILYFNDLRTEPLNTFFRGCTLLGEDWAYYLAGLAALFIRFRFVLLIALTGLFVMPVSYLLKDKIGNDRPLTWFEKREIRSQLVVVPEVELASGQTSFPSGHTMSAFALFSVLTMMLPRRRAWLGLLTAYSAILVAISRIFLAQHFLIDVLGGAVVGLAVGWVVWRISQLRGIREAGFLDRKINFMV